MTQVIAVVGGSGNPRGMTLPFTVDDFFAVFARHNQAIWPAQLVVYAAAVALTGRALWRPARASSTALGALLAALWILVGGGYHLAFFRSISGIALPAGVLFILTGLGFAWATARGHLAFSWRRDAWAVAGLALVLYAMIGYPLVGMAVGQRYPRMPMFGVVPCPTTIFTFGLLLLSARRIPGWLLVVPAAWALFATSAAFALGVTEDLALPVAALLGTAGVLLRNRELARAAHA